MLVANTSTSPLSKITCTNLIFILVGIFFALSSSLRYLGALISNITSFLWLKLSNVRRTAKQKELPINSIDDILKEDKNAVKKRGTIR